MRRAALPALHRAYDRGQLDLLPYLEPEHREEVTHAPTRLSLLAVLERLSGRRWVPMEDLQVGR